MVITLKVTKVPPVYPSQRVFMQDRFVDREYLPLKKPRVSFKSVLEKEMQGIVSK
ncbi:hypothetical protein [Sporomusa malonica]|uniref:Uncharacterized protein n=1 Tax=Sporomusa malonica TaxID=112901 RepID=A0A1W2CAL5_9FIRM|nr:hypothetical protein [Sporomusa malonica]SMC82136.1 hypothetical protein SAMN04488500_1102 [Sporomusa malonica]